MPSTVYWSMILPFYKHWWWQMVYGPMDLPAFPSGRLGFWVPGSKQWDWLGDANVQLYSYKRNWLVSTSPVISTCRVCEREELNGMFTNRAKLGLASLIQKFLGVLSFFLCSSNDSRLHKRRVAFPFPKTLDFGNPEPRCWNIHIWHQSMAIQTSHFITMGDARNQAIPQAIAIMRLFSFFSSPLFLAVYFLCNDLAFIPKQI